MRDSDKKEVAKRRRRRADSITQHIPTKGLALAWIPSATSAAKTLHYLPFASPGIRFMAPARLAIAPLWSVACVALLWPGSAEADGMMRALPPSVAGPDTAIVSVAPLAELTEVEAHLATSILTDQPYPELCDFFCWQLLPDGLMFPAYLAGGRESRFASQWVYERDKGWLWDVALGGRAAILRFGTSDQVLPEGFQLDIEGATFPRLNLEECRRLDSVDFRFGIPLTARRGHWEGKFAYYHLSSHLGDEFFLDEPEVVPINYIRDVLVLAVAVRPHTDLRFYVEAGWAFLTDGGSQPWEFQFGADYSPVEPSGLLGAPFFAINGRIREEIDFAGNLTVQVGVQWRGQTGKLFRTGLHYFNGKTDQYQFFREHEEQIGLGLWYDY
jgi:hypothetical protein